MDWRIWRLVTSALIRVTLQELDEWNMLDLLHAHLTLNALEAVGSKAPS